MSTTFKAQRVTRTGEITLHALPEKVFPLFGPVREAEWAEGWEPVVVYSESPLAEEEGAVFTSPNPGEADTIWIITRYDPVDYHIEYARITPGSTAVRLVIDCEAAPGGMTTARVTYHITTLSETGQGFIDMHYQDMLAHWQTAINHLLATGRRMPHHS